MDQIFLINKPKGKTSYQIVREFKKKYPGEKVGHAGTLDPLAEGLLIILIGKATKRQSEFMALEKEYLAEAVLGITTETWDLEKEPELYPAKDLKKRLEELDKNKVKKILKTFEGEFLQIVPPYSAVKVRGQRLYHLARKGKIDFQNLPKKKIRIYKIKLLDFKPARFSQKEINSREVLKSGPQIKIEMTVSQGTYVRSIVYQLGEKLKTGAVTSKLVRTRVGGLKFK